MIAEALVSTLPTTSAERVSENRVIGGVTIIAGKTRQEQSCRDSDGSWMASLATANDEEEHCRGNQLWLQPRV